MAKKNVIVAEVTKSWRDDDKKALLVAQQFELTIKVNADRGYRLFDWRYGITSYPDPKGVPIITETIIAVFVRRGSLADVERNTDA